MAGIEEEGPKSPNQKSKHRLEIIRQQTKPKLCIDEHKKAKCQSRIDFEVSNKKIRSEPKFIEL